MTVLLIVLLIVSVPLLVLVVAQRVTRPAGHVPPRRREFNRERAIALSAQSALVEVREVLSRYQPLLGSDHVGGSLVAEIQERLAEHEQRMLEVDR